MATSAEPGRKAAYSSDLRWRIIWQRFGMELCFRKVAENLNIMYHGSGIMYHGSGIMYHGSGT